MGGAKVKLEESNCYRIAHIGGNGEKGKWEKSAFFSFPRFTLFPLPPFDSLRDLADRHTTCEIISSHEIA
jgi:hypothetical protein